MQMTACICKAHIYIFMLKGKCWDSPPPTVLSDEGTNSWHICL